MTICSKKLVIKNVYLAELDGVLTYMGKMTVYKIYTFEHIRSAQAC